MTPAGWIVMFLGVGGMTALLAWCVFKILSTPEATRHLHSPADIDTGDLHE